MLRKTGISPYIPRFWGAFGGLGRVYTGMPRYAHIWNAFIG